MITMKVTSNISFSKLSNSLDKIINKTLNNAAQDSADLSKSNIDKGIDFKGAPLKRLSEGTMRVRERGGLVGNAIPTSRRKQSGLANIGGDKPLKYTGNLYNSIIAKKNTLTMEGYASEHNDGFTFSIARGSGGVFKKEVPPRPFIETIVGEDTKDKFVKDINKNLKK